MAKLNLEVTSTGIRKTEKEIKSLDKEVIGLTKTNIELNKSLQSLDKTSKTYKKDKENLTKAIKKNNLAQKEARNNMRDLNFESRNASSGISNLRGGFIALGAVIATLGIRDLTSRFIKTADSVTNMQSKLNLATNSIMEFAKAEEELFKISQQTRTGLLDNAELYQRISLSTKELGLSQKTVLRLTESINKSLIISGTTADGASTLITQLGQAFSSNFQAVSQELNTLKDQAPSLYQTLLAGMDVTGAKFKKMAEDGKLSSELIINAIKKQEKATDADFVKMTKTVSQAQTQISNSMIILTGDIDESLGITKNLSSAFTSLSASISEITKDDIEDIKEIAKSLTLIGVGIGGAILSFKAFNKVMVTSRALSLAYAGSVNLINARLITSITLSRSLTLAMRAIPFVAVAGSIALIADNILTANSNANTLENTLSSTSDELKKLTKNQLEYSKALLETELIQTRLDRANAIADASNKSIFESKEEHKRDLAFKDEQIKKFREQTKKLREIKQLIRDINDPKEVKEATPSTNNVTNKITEDEAKLEEKRQADILKSQNESLRKWQTYYQTIGDYETSWQLKRVILRQEFTEQTEEEFNKLAESIKVGFFDKVEKEQDKLKLDDFSFNIQADPFEGWGSSLNDLSSTLEDMGDEQKTFTKFTKEYNKAILDAGKDESKIAKVKEKFSKGEIKHQSNLIKGYSNIAGSLGGLFKEGSDGAKAMMITQSALATVNAVNAVLTQGQGDPYTAFARMATMSASVAGLLSSIGLAFNGSSGNDSSFKTNTGTGTVLGDEEAKSESIANSLSLLEDLARPEFKLLSEMNASLKSIDAKTQNLARGILQAGGFAVGEGFEGFEKQNFSFDDSLIVDVLMAGTNKIVDKLTGGLFSSLFGGITNSILGGLFGKTSASLNDAGITFGSQNILDAMEQLQGQSFQRIKIRKKSWFGSSTKYKMRYQALDEDVERQFSLVLKDIYNVVQTGGEALKVPTAELQKNLDSFTVSIGKISLKGKSGEQIQETLTSIFGKIGDQLARQAIPIIDEFQKVGEGTFETLTRVATGMQEANFFIEKLGNTFEEINYQDLLEKQGDVGLEALRQSITKFETATFGADNGVLKIIETLQSSTEEMFNTYSTLDDLRNRIKFFGHDIQGLTTSMLLGAGGIDKLKEGFDVYFDKFLSESEQQEFRIQSMTAQFKKLGLELPESRDAFKELLGSIDLTTEEGQKLYGSMLNLADGFADATEAQEKYNKAMAKTREDTQKVIDELTGTSSSGGNTFSQLSQLNRLKTEYAKTKDVNTFNEILALSRSLGKDDRFTDSIVGFLRNSLDTFATPALSESSVNTPYVVPTTSQTPTTSNVQSTLTQSATNTQQAINLNAGYTAEMLTQITELNQKFKEVTNGGNAMRSELVAI